MSAWIKTSERFPDNEDTVEVRTSGGKVLRAWWKGIGWKYGSGMWLMSDVVAWRQI